jgi:molecular chaperone DnaK
MFLPEKHSFKPSRDAVYFGIDLGTTYTLVATVDSAETDINNIHNIPVKFISYKQTSPVKHGGEVHSEMVASIIAMSEGRPYCGSKLYELKGHENFIRNQNIFYHWKLDLGIDRHPLYPDAVSNDLNTPAKIAGKILKFCKVGYTKNPDSVLQNTVITVPASFQMNQRKDVIEAASIAGIELSNKMLIDEPNAAFIGYFNSLDQEKKHKFLTFGKKSKVVLVFDIGGGTCDLSILEVGYHPEKGLMIGNKAISRYNDLGGQDIDMIIAEEILYPLFLSVTGMDDDMPFKDLTEIILPQLATIGEHLKVGICNLIAAKYPNEKLNKDKLNQTTFTIENRTVYYRDQEFKLPPLEITGSRFAEIVDKLFENTGYQLKYQDKLIKSAGTTINEILEKANLNKLDIDVVLPVGGSSSNPALIDRLKELFENSKFWLPSTPDKLVAEGAAIYSFFYHRFGKALVNPICSETIGIETKGRTFFPLIEKGSELPVKVSMPHFKMQGVSNDEIIIPVCLNDTNYIVQEIKIPLIKLYSGNETIKIDAEIDANKVLSLEIFIDNEPIYNYTLENPFFFGSLSKEQVKFVQLSEELDKARRTGNNNKQRALMEDLLSQYYDVKNYHEMARISDEYLRKYNANNSNILNYSYIGNSKIGRKDAALKALEKAIQLQPNEGYLRYNYSLMIEGKHGREEALNYLLGLPTEAGNDMSVKLRILILQNNLGINSLSEISQMVAEYQNAPHRFSRFDIDNLLPRIHTIAGKSFARTPSEEDKNRENKVLIAGTSPKKLTDG